MTTFDMDTFNEATQALWDLAYSKGHHDGEEKGRHETANWQLRGNLDLASRMLRKASCTDSDDIAGYLAQYAKTLLARTPQMHPSVGQVLDVLRATGRPDRIVYGHVAEALDAALNALGGYR